MKHRYLKVWQVVRPHKLVVIHIFSAILLYTLMVTNRQPPVYLARAKVEVGEPKCLSDIVYRHFSTSEAFFSAQQSPFRNIRMMNKVVKRLDLSPEWASEEDFKRLSRVMLSKIRTRRQQYTNIIVIEAVSENPREAMDLANTFACVYVDEHLGDSARKIRDLRRLVEGQLAALKERYGDSNDVSAGILKDWEDALVTAKLMEIDMAADVTIIERAALPRSPMEGDRKRNIIIAAIMGLIMAVSFAFLLERLENKTLS